jgi:hypothetical protein
VWATKIAMSITACLSAAEGQKWPAVTSCATHEQQVPSMKDVPACSADYEGDGHPGTLTANKAPPVQKPSAMLLTCHKPRSSRTLVLAVSGPPEEDATVRYG